MPNTHILQYPHNKQFMITLPRGLVLAKRWKKGDRLIFLIDSRGDIIIKKAGKND